jgi:single-stranded DNA-specific DHH superfamily exonuclease
MGIPQEQLDDFRQRVLASKRPLFFYDDDADGLCSYLLCFHAREGQALGIRVHSSAALTADYARKIEENQPDLVVVLDKPYIEQQFLEQVNVPLLWLDHHEAQKKLPANVTYYNPRVGDDADNRSTTYWVWKALGRPQDLWIAAVGNISDWQITSVAEEFWKQHPEILSPVGSAPEALFSDKHKFGTLARIVQFNLKGDSAEVRTAIKILSRIESPNELLEHTSPRAKLLFKRYQNVERQYQKMLQEARRSAGAGRLLHHVYGHLETSLLSEVSNQLIYEYPEKIVFIAREHNGEIKLSIRSATVPVVEAVRSALDGLRGNAGGHTHACGGNLKAEDFPVFFRRFSEKMGLAPGKD